MRHEAKTAYSQNTVQRLKTYNKIKLQGVHKYVIYNDNYNNNNNTLFQTIVHMDNKKK